MFLFSKQMFVEMFSEVITVFSQFRGNILTNLLWSFNQACHNFFVKKPKIFENVKSERAAANFQKRWTPRASTIISKNSQI